MFLTPQSIILTPGLKIAITWWFWLQVFKRDRVVRHHTPPIYVLNMKQIRKKLWTTAWTQAVVKIFDVFDSPEHNFDSCATKRIRWPDLCHSKPLAKFKTNPKRNVACWLNTRKSLRTHDPLFRDRISNGYFSIVRVWQRKNVEN